MNADAIFAFVLAIVTAAGQLFVTNPAVSTILTHITAILTTVGAVLHLDGK